MAAAPPVMINSPIHKMVSRMAGPLRRCMSSFMRLRGTGERYHSTCDKPRSTACLPSIPSKE